MTAVQRSHRMTVEEAWLARQRGGSAEPRPDGPLCEAEVGRPGPPDPVIGEPVISGRGPSGARGEEAGVGGADPKPAITDPAAVIRPWGHVAAPITLARPGMPITPAPPRPEVRPPARPRIEPEPAILGLSRHTRSRLGSRLFNLFFLFVFVLILVQMVVALLTY